jgi:hypothetical protein
MRALMARAKGRAMKWNRSQLLGLLVMVFGALNLSASADAPAGRYMPDVDGGTVYDTQTGLTWQRDASTDQQTWAAARATCAALVATLGDVYRLPTIKELQTLVDYSATASPVLDPTAFPYMPGTAFWSSTAFAGTTDSAWMLEFGTGVPYSPPKTTQYYVRCVR